MLVVQNIVKKVFTVFEEKEREGEPWVRKWRKKLRKIIWMVSSIWRKILLVHNPNIFLLKIALMERPTPQRAARKNNEILNLAILKIPDPSKLVEMESRPNNNFIRYYNSKKKENIAMHAVKIEKAKLLTNLEIYEWRNQT